LTLLDTANIDLATIDLSKVSITTSLDGLTAPLLATLQGLIGPALAALPAIRIPATIAQLKVSAPEQTVVGGDLTQRALHATLTLAGQPILDVVAGEAKAGRTGACPPVDDGPTEAQGTDTPAPAPAAAARRAAAPVGSLSASDQLLACTDRKLVMLDVLPSGSKVKIKGAADRGLVGRSVRIRLRATGRVVATAKVGKDGFFTTTAALPSRAIRSSNAARHRAELGKAVSLPLKLHRRMTLTRLTATGGSVTLAGRVELPLSDPVDPIRLVRRVSCHKTVLVKSFRPAADGTFAVKVAALPRRRSTASPRACARRWPTPSATRRSRSRPASTWTGAEPRASGRRRGHPASSAASSAASSKVTETCWASLRSSIWARRRRARRSAGSIGSKRPRGQRWAARTLLSSAE
jgi:hypothetical protein